MRLGSRNRRTWWVAAVAVVTLCACCARAVGGELTVEELKERVAKLSLPERASLCVEISERQLEAASKLFEAGDNEKAQGALVDVVAFSGLARDYAIQAHKREKQSEIAVRKMIRRLDGLKHAVAHEDQRQILESVQSLEKIRDDLLAAMFPRVKK